MPLLKAPFVIMDTILDVFGYATARVLLPIVTFGKVRAATISEDDYKYNWLGARREEDGTILLDSPTAGWVGYFFWLFVLAVVLWVVRGL